VNVAAGVEDTDRTAPARDRRHQALAVLIGNWINEGHTVGTGEIPSVPILRPLSSGLARLCTLTVT
jgi:hypothetical protein